MPRNPLISGNGNANDHADQQTQLQVTLVTTVTTLGFW